MAVLGLCSSTGFPLAVAGAQAILIAGASLIAERRLRGTLASVAVVHGLSSYVFWALEHGLSSCGAWAQ